MGALFHESCRRSIPCNPNRLIDLKQSITLSGVGIAQFESAVKGLLVIYQMFEAEVARTGNKLRPWQTRRDSDDLVLHFANRILTSRKDAGEEEAVDLESVIDPLNVLRPLLRGEVHLQDNVVEYWEQRLQGDGTKSVRHVLGLCRADIDRTRTYARITPDRLPLAGLVEVQVGFSAVRLGHQEYVFLPKLRAVCLLERQVELVCHDMLCCISFALMPS